MQHEAVKTEATLELEPSSPNGRADKAVTFDTDDAVVQLGTTLHEQPRQLSRTQRDGLTDVLTTDASISPSGFQPVASKRSRVTFAVAEDESHLRAHSPLHRSSASQPSYTEDDSASEHSVSSTEEQDPNAAAQVQNAGVAKGLFGRTQRSFTDKLQPQLHISPGASASEKPQHGGSSSSSQVNAAASQDQDEEVDSLNPTPRHHSVASMLSAGVKGLLGGASARLISSIMGRVSVSSKESHDEEQKEELWFTSLDDFKPICHMLHKGRYMSAYFACANRTGQHFLLKKYDKHKMVPAEERGVRRSIAFSELLRHPNLVKCVGQWEADDIIYVVEEYAGKGDIFNDAISHPEKYTERYVAVYLVKPLLQVLSHLHANNIIHRSVLPENLYMAIDDVLKLGHLTLAVDQLSDRPKSRTALLDYMAPEMLSVKPHNEHELAHLMDDSSEEEDEDCEQQHSASGLLVGQPEPSRGSSTQLAQQQWEQASVSAAVAGSEQDLHAAQQLAAEASSSTMSTAASRSSSRARLRSRSCATGCHAEWEYLDYYDEKVDIWQVGCLVHELLCGSMPFEVDSKLDSAGLALWADIEQPPGSLPPDCVQFLQQALTKDPKQRPSAADLLQHPWLARCETGEPWRDPMELEAARRAAELATVPGWLRHHSRVVVSGLTGLVQVVMHGNRVQPIEAAGDSQQQQQQQQQQQGSSVPGSPNKQWVTRDASPFEAMGGSDAALAAAGVHHGQMSSRVVLQQQQQVQQQQWSAQQQWLDHADAVMPVNIPDGAMTSTKQQHGTSPSVKLTAELIGRLNADWQAEHKAAAPKRQDSEALTGDSNEQIMSLDDDSELQDPQAACIVTATKPQMGATCGDGLSRAASKAESGSARPLVSLHQQRLVP